MTTYLGVKPAYGRDFKSQKAVREAYAVGLDFQVTDFTSPDYGRYVNKNDHPAGVTLQVRYKADTMVMMIPPPA